MADLLTKVKNALGIVGNYQDETLKEYIEETKAFLIDAGVAEEDITSGIVARGVSDLWNYGSGSVGFSQYFYQRAIQLAYQVTPENDTDGVNEIDQATIDEALGVTHDEVG